MSLGLDGRETAIQNGGDKHNLFVLAVPVMAVFTVDSRPRLLVLDPA